MGLGDDKLIVFENMQFVDHFLWYLWLLGKEISYLNTFGVGGTREQKQNRIKAQRGGPNTIEKQQKCNYRKLQCSFCIVIEFEFVCDVSRSLVVYKVQKYMIEHKVMLRLYNCFIKIRLNLLFGWLLRPLGLLYLEHVIKYNANNLLYISFTRLNIMQTYIQAKIHYIDQL